MVQDEIKVIEGKYGFYRVKDKNNNFIWDAIRYDVINLIMAKTKSISIQKKDGNLIKFKRHLKIFKIYFAELLSLIKIPFLSNKKYVFSVCPRFKNGIYTFDKSADDIINLLDKNEYYIINHFESRNTRYKSHYDSLQLFLHLAWQRNKDDTTIRFFVDSINLEYRENVISNKEVENLINKFYLSVSYYKYLLQKIKPVKVFISYGRYKAMTAAAHSLNIKVFLLQHALVFENDFALCNTSPDKKYGYYPDCFLTYGSFWGQYMSLLTEVLTIGNDYLTSNCNRLHGEEVLFISTDYHYVYLLELAKEFAKSNPYVNCSYRLHPNEYNNAGYYKDHFSNFPNLHIVTNGLSINESIEKCNLVVGIFSTALFEALHNHRKVAIYDIPAFTSLTSQLSNIPNVLFIKNADELAGLLNIDYLESDITFFEQFDKGKVELILNLT